jgi:hypothetical protein
MSFSISISTPPIDPAKFEMFCLHHRYSFIKKTKKALHFRSDQAEIIFMGNLIFVTLPWKSKHWRDLWQPARTIAQHFDGKMSGDGIPNPVDDIDKATWEKQFIAENGACSTSKD